MPPGLEAKDRPVDPEYVQWLAEFKVRMAKIAKERGWTD